MNLVSFEQIDVADILNEIVIDGTTDKITVNTAVQDLATSPTSGTPYFKAQDTNGVWDASCNLPAGATATAKFTSAADSTVYYRASHIWIFGHPRPRPQ